MKTRSWKHALVALAGWLLLAVPVLGWAGSPGGSDALQVHGDRAIIVQKARQPVSHHRARCHETHFQQGACKALKAELASCQEDLAACRAEPCAILPGDGQTGAPLSYTDNGDGTFTDDNTGLMWEIKTSDGSIHDYGHNYSWTDTTDGDETNADGTAFTVFLAALNDPQNPFAGHTDWRLPTVKELQSLVDYTTLDPAASVPGETMGFYYWSSTYQLEHQSQDSNDVNAELVSFINGGVGYAYKFYNLHVRAVRGGW